MMYMQFKVNLVDAEDKGLSRIKKTFIQLNRRMKVHCQNIPVVFALTVVLKKLTIKF